MTVSCKVCGEGFEPRSRAAKYCSSKCKWKMHRINSKECERQKKGFYEKRIRELTDAGYIVFRPEGQVIHLPDTKGCRK